MEPLFLGIATLSVVVLGYLIAYRQYAQKHWLAALVLIMLSGLALRLFTASDFFLHPWDERYHALVAKNLIHHPWLPTLYENSVLPLDFKNWTATHIWVHKQPFPLWTMALSMRLFGFNEMALRLPSIVLSTLGIGITFAIARQFFNTRVAFIASFLYSIHGLIIELSAGRVATDHFDVFFLFFIQLGVWMAIRFFQTQKVIFNLLCGLSVGLAILTKWLPALIVIPLWLLLAYENKRLFSRQTFFQFLLLIGMVAVVSLPWQGYIFTTFPQEAQWESSFNFKHLTQTLENHSHPFYYHFDKLRMIYGELIYLPLLWFFYHTFKTFRNPKRWILTLWILIPFLFFTLAKTKMQAYTLFTAPAIFMVTALFWDYLYAYRNQFKYKGWVVVLLVLLLALPIRFSLERIKPFSLSSRNPLWSQELKALANQSFNKENTVIFNTEHPIETMFYTHCIAYEGIPDTKTLDEIYKKGYRIYLRQARELSSSEHRKPEEIWSQPYQVVYISYKPIANP